jgi:N-acetylglucosaminyldiphosphoundecaprenol N-acetyl-beta-D-mannosaminyltransferase
MIGKKTILGVGITDATRNEVLEYIIKNLQNFKKKLFIVTPNPEFLVLAHKNTDFKNILNKSDLASPDGIGILMAAKFVGEPLKERFTGVDLMESLCREVAEKPITVGFLGGRAGVAEKTADCLLKKYPGLKVAFVGEEWPSGDFARQPRILEGPHLSNRGPVKSNPSHQGSSFASLRVHAVGSPSSFATPDDKNQIDILFVAFGAPKQEFWINENLDKIPVKVAIGVGGAFDYISNKIPRAPTLVRSIGLEWLFRLAIQPWRLKRQLALIKFILLVFKEKLNKS